MGKIFIAELSKMSQTNMETIEKNGQTDDKLIFFCEKGESMSIETHMLLNRLSIPTDFITTETDAEKIFHLGAASTKGELSFLTPVSIPSEIKKILKMPETTKKKTAKTTAKTTIKSENQLKPDFVNADGEFTEMPKKRGRKPKEKPETDEKESFPKADSGKAGTDE